MSSVLATALMEGIGTACAVWIGHIFGRKKTLAEIKEIEANATLATAETERVRIQNIDDIIAIYTKANKALLEQLDRVSKKCDALSDEIHQLRGENLILKSEILKLNKNFFNSQALPAAAREETSSNQ